MFAKIQTHIETKPPVAYAFEGITRIALKWVGLIFTKPRSPSLLTPATLHGHFLLLNEQINSGIFHSVAQFPRLDPQAALQQCLGFYHQKEPLATL